MRFCVTSHLHSIYNCDNIILQNRSCLPYFAERKGKKMKKFLVILLAVAMLLSLCACGDNETQATDPKGDNQSTTSGEKTTETATTGSTEGTSENSTEAPTTGTTEEPTQGSTQAPVTNTTCTHSWKAATCTTAKTCTKCGATEGKAAGHNWAAATCTAPKTCKTCKTTEGKAAGHNWTAATCSAPKTCKTCKVTEGSKGNHTYTNGVCTICKATSVLNPKTNLSSEEYVGNFGVSGTELIGAGIQLDGETLIVLERYFTSAPSEEDRIGTPIVYKGTNYYSQGAGQTPHYYELTDTEIIVKGSYWGENADAVTIKMVLQADGMLKVTYSTNERFPVGTILSKI